MTPSLRPLVELLARAAYAELMRPPVSAEELVPAGDGEKARGDSQSTRRSSRK